MNGACALLQLLDKSTINFVMQRDWEVTSMRGMFTNLNAGQHRQVFASDKKHAYTKHLTINNVILSFQLPKIECRYITVSTNRRNQIKARLHDWTGFIEYTDSLCDRSYLARNITSEHREGTAWLSVWPGEFYIHTYIHIHITFLLSGKAGIRVVVYS